MKLFIRTLFLDLKMLMIGISILFTVKDENNHLEVRKENFMFLLD